MDELLMVKDARPDVAEAQELVLLRARRGLLKTAVGPAVSRRRRRRLARVGVVAAASVAMVGLGLVTFHGHPVSSPASASEILDRAATATLRSGAAPFDHITVTSDSAEANYATSGKVAVGADGKPLTWRVKLVTESWIATDSPVSLVTRSHAAPYDAQSADAKPFMKAGSRPLMKIAVDPATDAYSSDPATLLKQLKTGAVKGPWDAGTVSKRFAGLFFASTTSAKVRAAGFRALKLVPGVRVSDRTATLAGHTGVALSYPDGMTFVFDSKTGTFIGSTWPVTAGSVPETTVLAIEPADSAPDVS